jgi:hypothetical protein
MIQRKQSVYLLLVAVLMSWLLVRPYAEIKVYDGHSLLFYSLSIRSYAGPDHFERVKQTIALALIIIATGILNFATIFYFSRRIIQMRLCIVSIIMLSSIILIMIYYYMQMGDTVKVIGHAFRFASIFPIVSLIANFLAYRAINQDEELVKSYDRIR